MEIISYLKSHIIETVTCFVTVFGFIIACAQLRSANKNKRAELLNEINAKLRFNEGASNAFYLIEYHDDWYTADFHDSSCKTEKEMDEFLSYLSFVCYLRKEGFIKKKEFKSIEYVIDRVCSNCSVQKYLWNIYHFSKRRNLACSFEALINYMITGNYVNEDQFMNSKSKGYPKYLNFD